MRLSWAAKRPPSLAGFRIYRDGSLVKKVGRVREVTLTAENRPHHGYAVSAIDKRRGESRRSRQVFAKALPAKPLPPGRLQASGYDQTRSEPPG